MTTVIHLISDANYSGAPAHVLQLATGLTKSQLRSVVIGPEGPIVQRFKDEEIAYHPVSFTGKFNLATKEHIERTIKQIIKDSGDSFIIHCHGVRAGLFGRQAARSFSYPVIYTEHLWTADYHLPNKLNEHFQLMMLRKLDRITTKTIGVSQSVVDFLITSKISRPDKTVCIYNGVEIPKRQITPTDKPVLGSIGTLTWQKNYHWLIKLMPDVLKEVPEVKLEIIGEGSEKDSLLRLIEQLNLQQSVSLLEPVPHEQLVEHYARWALYIQPSVNESFGLALAEAVAAGLPALGSRVGSIPEILDATEATFDLNDKQKTVSTIAEYLKDQKKRTQLQAKECETVKQFTIPHMIAEHEKLYKSVLS